MNQVTPGVAHTEHMHVCCTALLYRKVRKYQNEGSRYKVVNLLTVNYYLVSINRAHVLVRATETKR